MTSNYTQVVNVLNTKPLPVILSAAKDLKFSLESAGYQVFCVILSSKSKLQIICSENYLQIFYPTKQLENRSFAARQDDEATFFYRVNTVPDNTFTTCV